MQAPDPIEVVMARLMPPALSDSAQQEIEEMLDGLAGPAAAAPRVGVTSNWLVRTIVGGGIAAGIGAMFAILPGPPNGGQRPALAKQPRPAAPAFVLMSESERIESVTDDGWREDADGTALRALRLKLVEENKVRDGETGMEVRISEPREEILLVPISEF